MPPLAVDAWRTLLTPDAEPLLAAVRDADPGSPATLERLRRLVPPGHDAAALVRVAMQRAHARRKADAKRIPRADRLLADPDAIEQATAWPVALYKARRLAHAWRQLATERRRPLLDLCSGAGIDAMALRNAGTPVLALDADPARALMTRHNAGCPVACADIANLRLAGRPFHLDPARRDAATGRRAHRLADYAPDPYALADPLAAAPFGLIKLSPGVDRDEAHHLADRFPADTQLEFVSHDHALGHAHLWLDTTHALNLTNAPRAAARIDPIGQAATLAGAPGQPDIAPLGAYLFTVDAAVERAELMHRLGLPSPHPALGLLTADEPSDSPWLTPFRVLDHRPYQLKRLKRILAEHHAGVVEVKTRDKAVDPDRLQHQLRGNAPADPARTLTVFVLRWDRSLHATVTRRL
ncbi:MAG: class I SAM-dependent methyltransferase [Planctomycetota bacterium]